MKASVLVTTMHVPPNPAHNWRGIYPAICTPFAADDAVDLDAQRSVVRFALAAGAHGIVAFGLAGEVSRLSADERRRLTDVIVDEVGGAVPVLVGAGASSVRESIEIAHHAERAGASCIVLPAPSGGTGEVALVEYFARIAASVSLPVMIQDAPAYLGVGLGPALVQRIAEAADNVRLVKLEAGPAEMSTWFDALGDDFAIWGGDGGVYLLDCIRSGAHGIIPGADLVDLLVAVYEAHALGDEAHADALFARVLPTLVFEMQDSIDHYNACAKLVLKERGVLTRTHLRQPAASLSRISQELLIRHLSTLQLMPAEAHVNP
jgi:4-hydroxy-tetrahydrodipicolinate synthase